MGRLIKTLIPFDEEFMPSSLIDREVERVELRRFLEPLSKGEIQLYNMLITGSVGVGKTVLTRFITRELPTHSYYIRFNEAYNTFPKFLYKIIITLGLPISPYISSNIALTQLTEHISRQEHSILLVLDDIDKVPIQAMRPLLHEIPRATNKCNFLLISRIPAVLDDLPADTKSTLKCRELPLQPYNKEALYQIVKQRAELALTSIEVIDEEVLEKISEVASLSGSAREAIDLLKTACQIADYMGHNRVTVNEFEEALEEIERKSLEDTIKSLPPYHRLILECCDKFPKTYDFVYKLWLRRLEQHGLKKLSIYRFRDFVHDLKKLDLIHTEIKGKGRGRGFSYYLILAPHIKKEMLLGGDRRSETLF